MVSKKFGLVLVSAGALAASGCASIPDDRGMSNVRQLVAARGGPAIPDAANADARPAFAGKTLSVQDAVQVALTHNLRLRRGYAQLGFAGAEVYEAGRLSNPTLSLSVLDPSGVGAANQITVGLAQNFTNLLMMPARSRIAEGEFERAKALVGADVLRLAAEVEAAYYSLIGAQQVAAMRETIGKAARASADLAQRYFDAGNINELQLRLEQATASQAHLDSLTAQAEVARARSQLNTLLGLTEDEGKWVVPDRLPLPATGEDEPAELQTLASANRLDLAAARKEVELLRAGVKLTRRFRYFGDIEVGVERKRDTDRTRLIGPTLSLAIPIFNQNQGGVLRVTSQLESAEAELRELEIGSSNEIQLAHQRVLNARAKIQEFRKNLLPLRQKAVARMQERVNYMLDGVFDLLRLKQEEYDAYQGYLEAVRDYWTARAELGRLVGTQLPSTARITGATVGPHLPERPAESGEQMLHDGKAMDGMMNGMDHSAGQMKSAPSPAADPHAGHAMPGMDMGDMKGMDHGGQEKPATPPPTAEKPTGMDMKGMDHSAPADPAAAATCDQAKNADMSDPLMQALAQKCREQERPAARQPSSPAGSEPSPSTQGGHPGDHANPPPQAPAGSPDGDGSSAHGEHQH